MRMTLSRNLARSLAVAAPIAMLTLVAQAQAPAQNKAAAPGKDPAVATTIEQIKEHYRSLKLYQDVLISSQSIELEEGSSDPTNLLGSFASQTHQYTLAFEAPRRFKLEAEDVEIASDGKELIIASLAVDQFRRVPIQGESIIAVLKDDIFGQMASQHPILIFLLGESADDEQLNSVLNNAHAMRTADDGRLVISSVFEIPVTMRMPNMPAEVPLEIRVDPKTHAIESIATDMTAILRQTFDDLEKQGGMGSSVPQIESCWSTLSISDVRTNSEIPSSAFAIDTSSMEQVQKFDLSAFGRPATPDLIGKPAPMFTSRTLQGADFDLRKYKGKTIVLDFWATWCKPCVAAMPHVEKVWQDYKTKNVVVIGVNQDDGDMRDKMRDIIQKTGATFTQVMDPKGEIGKMYSVQALPTTVIIDSAGNVQVYEMGFFGDDHLKQQLEQVLSGK